MRGALASPLLALACLAFSIDEIAEIHERLGFATDALMSSGSREGTALWSTGLWPFVIGIPAIAAIAVVVRGTRHIFLARAPRALLLLIVGFIVMFTGALVVELGRQSREDAASTRAVRSSPRSSSKSHLEMLGVTLIAWSASSLLAKPTASTAARREVASPPAAAASASVRSAGS